MTRSYSLHSCNLQVSSWPELMAAMHPADIGEAGLERDGRRSRYLTETTGFVAVEISRYSRAPIRCQRVRGDVPSESGRTVYSKAVKSLLAHQCLVREVCLNESYRPRMQNMFVRNQRMTRTAKSFNDSGFEAPKGHGDHVTIRLVVLEDD
jgi:hypothetical protein